MQLYTNILSSKSKTINFDTVKYKSKNVSNTKVLW